MKITRHPAVPAITKTTVGGMPCGSIGVDSAGFYYFRTPLTAACLSVPGNSFSGCSVGNIDHCVELLKPGESITIEIE